MPTVRDRTDPDDPPVLATWPDFDRFGKIASHRSASGVLGFLNAFRQTRREKTRRAYHAQREAQALRMQFGPEAEVRCAAQLAAAAGNPRRERFLTLVQKALETE